MKNIKKKKKKKKKKYLKYNGFVVIMGTDTMAFAASALSFMAQNLGKPVRSIFPTFFKILSLLYFCLSICQINIIFVIYYYYHYYFFGF